MRPCRNEAHVSRRLPEPLDPARVILYSGSNLVGFLQSYLLKRTLGSDVG